VKGLETAGAEGVTGPLRESDKNAYPASRESPICWSENNGHLWLYGGSKNSETGEPHILLLTSIVCYTDTWRFDGEDWGYWSAGGNVPASGTLREFSFDYHPGRRFYPYGAANSNGSAGYLIGGGVSDLYYSDIWRFEGDKGWSHWGGIVGQGEPNGKMRVPDESNLIGARVDTTFATDQDDNIWIFGGRIESSKNNVTD